MGYPSVFATGTLLYDRERAYNGYTLFPSAKGALLIDMDGKEVQLWAGLGGFPNKLLPGGYVLGSTGRRGGEAAYQDQLDLVQVDWDGNVVWRFDRNELVDDGDGPTWVARQHHDFQREGSTVGYYYPGGEPRAFGGRTLLLTHANAMRPEISDVPLIDDRIIEVDWDGEVTWSWQASDHFDELGFDDAARAALREHPGLRGRAGGDWLHVNSMSTLGPNRWHDAGDERFAPENLIVDSRNANILAIISRRTGEVVWRVGPRYDGSEALRRLGWVIGQHHLHMIPRGLPGEGDLLVFDNGGMAGYGAPNPSAPTGECNVRRDYSRVLQIDPLTLGVTWQYTPEEAGFTRFTDGSRFYSPYVSSAQRLPNGNTLITEGSDGRLLEVTPGHDVVWEYVNPYFGEVLGRYRNNMVYRAYRVPYEWVPQLERPREVSIAPADVETLRVPGSPVGAGAGKVTRVEGVEPRARIPFGGAAAGGEGEPRDRADFCMVRLRAPGDARPGDGG
ncbi:MAG: aryl-sulfate sulfotransferase [Coriobacteriales bacterium]|jgi:hypothetical protein